MIARLIKPLLGPDPDREAYKRKLAEGKSGSVWFPVGFVLEHPIEAKCHIAEGNAEPADDEAREFLEQFRLAVARRKEAERKEAEVKIASDWDAAADALFD